MQQAHLGHLIDELDRSSPQWGIHYYPDRGTTSKFYSYPMLAEVIRRCATDFRNRGIHSGERVIFPFETSMTTVVAFLALVRAGALVLCVRPPTGSGDAGRYADYLAQLSLRHQAKWVFGVPSARALADEECAGLAVLVPGAHITEALQGNANQVMRGDLALAPVESGDVEALPDLDPDGIAFVQFSSGSTSFPKGVPITHRNLIQQLTLLRDFDRRSPGDVGASWLPLFHDMGLIGGLLSSLFAKLTLHLCSPRCFLADPLSWLEMVSSERVQRFAMPNFGIEYLLRALRNTDEEFTSQYRFDALTHIFIGAEPINPDALQEFIRFLKEHGMTRHAVQPAYGMAEAVLIATGGRDTEPRILVGPNGTRPVSAGFPLPGFEVAIADSDKGPDGAIAVGEILLRGGSLAAQYFEHPKALLDAQGFYHTGDIGFLDGGELFILGRDGDRLKLNAESYFAHDFERVIEGLPGVRPRSSVVLQVRSKLHVLIERPKAGNFERLRLEIGAAIYDAFGVKIDTHHMVALRGGQILRTSSGKLQRLAMMQAVEEGRLRTLEPHPEFAAQEASLMS